MTDPDSKEKQVAYYAAGVEAWYLNRLERDKSLLTLSAGGIGLLISLVSAFGISSTESLILFILALIAFILCLSAVLWIFQRNTKHIEDVFSHDKGNDPLLTVLDNAAVSTFLAGVVLSSVIGIAAAVHSFETKGTTMSDEKKVTVFNDSVNGIRSMRPGQTDLGRSVNGAGKLSPAALAAAQSQAAQSQPAQTPAAQPSTQATQGSPKAE
jgi:hypothetical protein